MSRPARWRALRRWPPCCRPADSGGRHPAHRRDGGPGRRAVDPAQPAAARRCDGMTLTPLFQIDGKPLYAPDADVSPSYADLDSSDSAGTPAASCTGRWCGRRWPPGPSPTRPSPTPSTPTWWGCSPARPPLPSPSPGGLLHRDGDHHLLLQQLQHRLAQRPGRHLAQPEIQHHRVLRRDGP